MRAFRIAKECGQDISANGIWRVLSKVMYPDLLGVERPQDYRGRRPAS
jgi:hypothetical protein